MASRDAITIYRELEDRIAAGQASEQARKAAYDELHKLADDGSAADAFARAAVAGRVAELRGLSAGKLVTEAEHYARLSRERDATYANAAATRMLGTLYVLAPPRLLEHGDSEAGLGLLEDLVHVHPEVPENHLRVAEAYVALGDPDPAIEHLCGLEPLLERLSKEDRSLYQRLVDDVDGLDGRCTTAAKE